MSDQFPWAIYSPPEEGWWNDKDGWGHLDTATRYTESESESWPGLSASEAMWVRVGDTP